jgi:hypothetical protein
VFGITALGKTGYQAGHTAGSDSSGKMPIRLVNWYLLIRDTSICNKCIENGSPGSGKLPIRLVNRHHRIRDICIKHIETGIPGSGKLLVNRHHLNTGYL